jgi:hypothetical protein
VKCFKGYECPFYHSQKDRRVVDFRRVREEEYYVARERKMECY